jgi:hypothetical protein
MPLNEIPASQQIDNLIQSQPNWRGALLQELRLLILAASSEIQEQVKWKMPSKPLGSPTWEVNGMICVADFLKKAVRLTFPKGAFVADPHNLFNARLDSKTARAIDFVEGEALNAPALIVLIQQAISLNLAE